MDLRRLSEHYADIEERAGQGCERARTKVKRGGRKARGEEEGERERVELEGRVGGSARGHGHLEHDTEKPKAIWSVLQPTHANLQIRIVKVRHCGRVGGGLRPSFGDTALRPRICSAGCVFREREREREGETCFTEAFFPRRVNEESGDERRSKLEILTPGGKGMTFS